MNPTLQTIISTTQLADRLGHTDWAIIDCRFDLGDAEAGRHAYKRAHIPGAQYAHLDDDLSGPPFTDAGRHPLPRPAALTATFGRLGIGPLTQVVAYDDSGGMVAARLWWLLQYMGHRAVSVLDGGWPAWRREGRPVRSGAEVLRPVARFRGQPKTEWLVQLEAVPRVKRLLDARAPERYRGDVEPLDPRAGHIPGALNYPYHENLEADGRMKPPGVLRQQLLAMLSGTRPGEVTHYCGSGVSACLNLLAQVHAGLAPGRLYAGSWSEWSADPDRPAATGTG